MTHSDRLGVMGLHRPDRLSCHRFRANAFRLQLHSLALLLLAYFRHAVLAGTQWASATIGTIRLHLLKVAGRVVRSVRRLWFHLASHWPGQPLFTRAVIARSRARQPDDATRDNFLDGTAAAAGGVVTRARRSIRAFRTPSLAG